MMRAQPTSALKIAVSSCLLGQAVRYDGRDKANAYLLGTLARHCQFQGICPEVGIGLGVPRPPIQLAGSTTAPRLVAVHDATQDHTRAMQAYARAQSRELGEVSGYIFKRNSPSCSLSPIPVHGANTARAHHPGLFAAHIHRALPQLPLIEAEALDHEPARENFLERVLAYRHWQQTQQALRSARQLQVFHERQRLLLMAHGEKRLRELEQALQALLAPGARQRKTRYLALYMTQLAQPATRSRHVRVLNHLLAALKPHLDVPTRQALTREVAAYRAGQLPLAAPLILLRHYALLHAPELIAAHAYLDPPAEAWFLRFR